MSRQSLWVSIEADLSRSKVEGGFLMRFCASIFYLPGTCALIICSMLGTLQRNPFYNLV